MALPKSRNKKVSSTIKTSHKLISGLLAFIFIFQIRLYKLDESYIPKSLTFKLSSTKLTSTSDSTTQLDAIQTINIDSNSSMDKQRSSNGTIPKLLWMFWDKGLDHLQSLSQDPKNKYAVDYQCVEAMMKLNSNSWDVKLLDLNGAKSLAPIYASLVNNETLYPKKLEPRMISNVLRLELLSRYGGVYADTSICPFSNLDSFITDWLEQMRVDSGQHRRILPRRIVQSCKVFTLINVMTTVYSLLNFRVVRIRGLHHVPQQLGSWLQTQYTIHWWMSG